MPFTGHKIRGQLEGTLKTMSSNPITMSRDIFHQTRFLRAPPKLALDTSRDVASAASLGNRFQCLTTLKVENLFLIFFSKPILFLFKAIVPYPVSKDLDKNSLSWKMFLYSGRPQ